MPVEVTENFFSGLFWRADVEGFRGFLKDAKQISSVTNGSALQGFEPACLKECREGFRAVGKEVSGVPFAEKSLGRGKDVGDFDDEDSLFAEEL